MIYVNDLYGQETWAETAQWIELKRIEAAIIEAAQW
jgi:hypothetical protein